MKMILKIAKKELQLLFYSPVAWFLLAVFVVQTAMVFTGKYGEFLYRNEWGGGKHFMASMALFARVWGSVLQYLYYYIPLLTMGLVSRELSSGSIKLLYSSPVTNAQIILGKFFSMVVFAGIMSAIMLVYVIVGWCTIDNFELAFVLSGLLGLFLVTCTYAAVGIFISSLTSYQFVSAIGTFIVLMLLSMVASWGQEYDVVRDITYWLSIGGRAGTFVSGMICSEDLLYFPIVTAMFLFLSIIRLKAVRQKVRFAVTFGRYFAVVFVTCLLGYLSSRPKLMAYYDGTSNLRNTLCEHSQEVVSKLDGDMTITAYSNILNPHYARYSFPSFIHMNRELFQWYARFKPELKLKVVYYYDTITMQDDLLASQNFAQMCQNEPDLTLWERAKKKCELYKMDSTMLKTPEEVREMTDLTGEKTFVWEIVRENGQRMWLRTFDRDPFTPFPYETEVTAALKRMVVKLPKVGFVKGYGLRSIYDYSSRGYSTIAGDKDFRLSLWNQGFDAVEVELKNGVPEDVDILTLADLRDPLLPEESKALEDYVARGGNLFILAEPRRREVMNPFLTDLFGVGMTEGHIVQYRWDWMYPDALYSVLTPEAKKLSYHLEQWYFLMPTTAGLEKVADKGFTFTPLWKSDTVVKEVEKKADRPYIVWNELGPLDYEVAPITYNPEAGEVAKEYCTGVGLTRMVGDKEQRVIITGDADCISNGEMGQTRSPNNGKMILGVYHYLSYNEMPIDARREKTIDTTVHLNRLGFNIMDIGFRFIFPLLFLGAGVFLWLRRRGR